MFSSNEGQSMKELIAKYGCGEGSVEDNGADIFNDDLSQVSEDFGTYEIEAIRKAPEFDEGGW